MKKGKIKKKIASVMIIAGITLYLIYAFYRQVSYNKVILIGLDGATWNIINPLIEEGQLPNFKKLKDGGSYGVCKSIELMISPAIWTSIATGKLPEKHGIDRFVTEVKAKDGSIDYIPITSNFRKVKALWNILTEYKKKSITLNYYVTYPPEKINGIMISRLDYCGEWLKYHPFNAEYWDYPYFSYPVNLDVFIVRLFHKRFAKQGERYEDNKQLLDIAIVKEITRYFLREEKKFNLFTTYTRSIDETEHLYWKYMEPEKFVDLRWNLTEEDIVKYKNRIKTIYKEADKFIGNIISGIDKNTIVLVVSDHGMKSASSEEQNDFIDSGVHDINGIIMLCGKNIKKKFEISNASVLDVTPTILYLLNLPIAKDMDGKVIKEAISPGYRLFHPVKYIDTYDYNWQYDTTAISSPFDEEIVKRLKSLGYLQ